jgi:hypothetical protein
MLRFFAMSPSAPCALAKFTMTAATWKTRAWDRNQARNIELSAANLNVFGTKVSLLNSKSTLKQFFFLLSLT